MLSWQNKLFLTIKKTILCYHEKTIIFIVKTTSTFGLLQENKLLFLTITKLTLIVFFLFLMTTSITLQWQNKFFFSLNNNIYFHIIT